MGAQNTKQVDDKAALTKVYDHPVQSSTVSTGFHILEIHMPSVGLGWLSILMLAIGAFAIFALWRKCRATGLQPHHGMEWNAPRVRASDVYARDRAFYSSRLAQHRFDEDRFQDLPREDRVYYSPGPPAIAPVPTNPQPVSAPAPPTVDISTC